MCRPHCAVSFDSREPGGSASKCCDLRHSWLGLGSDVVDSLLSGGKMRCVYHCFLLL